LMDSPVSTASADQLIEELKRELKEAHRREAATAEVLNAISRSTFNLQDVLDSLIESIVQLTGAETGIITRQDGEVYRVAATYGAYPEFIEIAKQNPLPPGRQSATRRAVLERRVVHIHDVFDDPEYTWVGRQTAGVRTILAVPMLREDIVAWLTASELARLQDFRFYFVYRFFGHCCALRRRHPPPCSTTIIAYLTRPTSTRVRSTADQTAFMRPRLRSCRIGRTSRWNRSASASCK
jgi:GAF domain-containing protein